MQNHYNYFFDDITNTYNFITKNNILYRVAFIVDETFSSISGEDISNIYQIIVEKASEELDSFDIKVSKTIEHIIDKFFQRTENSLIYVCSDEDERAYSRHKIFDRWYKQSEYRDKIVKLDNIFKLKTGDSSFQKLYTSFMFHKENSNYQKLITIYNTIEEALNSTTDDK